MQMPFHYYTAQSTDDAGLPRWISPEMDGCPASLLDLWEPGLMVPCQWGHQTLLPQQAEASKDARYHHA